jgi:hypothetical protein
MGISGLGGKSSMNARFARCERRTRRGPRLMGARSHESSSLPGTELHAKAAKR